MRWAPLEALVISAWVRGLSSIDLDYLFWDGSRFKMHGGTGAEPIMVACAITTVGQPVLVAVEPAAGESADAWADLLTGLRDRGLPVPLLTITDDTADASMSSAGFPAEPPASASSGPCSSGPPPAGEACATHPPSPGTSPTSVTNSTDSPPTHHQPTTNQDNPATYQPAEAVTSAA